MTTARNIITDALREIGVGAEGETISAEMADSALRTLNRLMELWSNSQSFAFYPSMISKALSGESSFTVGPTGDVVTDRPIKIDTAYVDRLGISYPCAVIDNQKYDAITYKAAAGANTTAIFYEATMPDGIVHVWPIATGCTLNMRVLNVVSSFDTLDTVLVLPPGYDEALVKNLAVNISPQYPGSILSQITVRAAATSMKTINRTNNVIPSMTVDRALLNRMGGGSLAGFLSGE